MAAVAVMAAALLLLPPLSSTSETTLVAPLGEPGPAVDPQPPQPTPAPTVRTAAGGFTAENGVFAPSATTPDRTVAATYEYRRVPLPRCGELDPLDVDRQCIDDLGVAQVCVDGSAPLAPLQRREVDPVTGAGLSPWTRVDPGGCQDGTDLVVLSVEEFRRLPLTASTPQYQPDDGRGLVNKDLIVYADPAPQTLATTVLGVPVTVRATPVAFAWDFGDGSDPLVTSDPGAPYPDHTVSYPYRQAGEFAVQLVTTWQGQYQVNSAGPWYPVAGTAATTSAPFTAQVFEAHAHLVADDLGT